ncbi:hypothetical protein HDU85_000683 [Gaertneriomyces sp. JEL0708]|nr:hypothetical protein HDU85_000683 [Gaertneriomyces sp. JEL0708]
MTLAVKRNGWLATIIWCALALTVFATPVRRTAITTTSRPLRPTPGNRTHYSDGTLRLGSLEVDTNYTRVASGNVTLLMPWDRATNAYAPTLKSVQQAWGASNNISVNWRLVSGSYDDYVNTILDACEKDEGAWDVVWIRADMVGKMSHCLKDIWAWNEAAAVEHGGVVARGAVVDDRLVGLPAELSFGIMLYNDDLLEKYGFPYPPGNLDELESMATAILKAERTLERYWMCGWAGPLSASENLTTVVSEWIGSVSGTILTETSSGDLDVSVATSPVANLFVRLVQWISQGVICSEDVGSATPDSSLQKFIDGKTIFLRTSTDMLKRIIDAKPSFNWGVAPLPSNLESGLGVGGVDGWYVGAYKYAPNPEAAVKTAEWLSSAGYQRDKILTVGMGMVGTYPEFLLDRQVCNVYGSVGGVSLCLTLSQVFLVRRPVGLAGPLWHNVSTAIQERVLQILQGDTYIVTGLQALDQKIRGILDLPPSNSTGPIIADPTVTKPGKAAIRKVGTQLSGLFLVVCITAVVVLLLRRKQRHDMELEEKMKAEAERGPEARVEMQAASIDDEEERKKARKLKGKGRATDEEEQGLIDKSEKIEI